MYKNLRSKANRMEQGIFSNEKTKDKVTFKLNLKCKYSSTLSQKNASLSYKIICLLYALRLFSTSRGFHHIGSLENPHFQRYRSRGAPLLKTNDKENNQRFFFHLITLQFLSTTFPVSPYQKGL